MNNFSVIYIRKGTHSWSSARSDVAINSPLRHSFGQITKASCQIITAGIHSSAPPKKVYLKKWFSDAHTRNNYRDIPCLMEAFLCSLATHLSQTLVPIARSQKQGFLQAGGHILNQLHEDEQQWKTGRRRRLIVHFKWPLFQVPHPDMMSRGSSTAWSAAGFKSLLTQGCQMLALTKLQKLHLQWAPNLRRSLPFPHFLLAYPPAAKTGRCHLTVTGSPKRRMRCMKAKDSSLPPSLGMSLPRPRGRKAV